MSYKIDFSGVDTDWSASPSENICKTVGQKKVSGLYQEKTDLSLRNWALHKADEILSTLDPREKKILAMRFGFLNGTSWTLEQVGYEFGCSKERIRQIERDALQKLHDASKEFLFFKTAFIYSGLSKRELLRYKTSVRCKNCETWYMLNEEGTRTCPKCRIKDDCLDRLDIDDFVVLSETETSFIFRHICGTRIEYQYESTEPLLCPRCEEERRARLPLMQKARAKQTVARNAEFKIEEENDSYLLLRHRCGTLLNYPYTSQEQPICALCRKKQYAKEMIDWSEFSIDSEQNNYFVLRHFCGRELLYFYESKKPPRCDYCHNRRARELIENSGFEIIGRYEMGFRIRHNCGWQQKFNYDCDIAPKCWHCDQNGEKSVRERMRRLPLDLSLLKNINEPMRIRLMDIGVDSTKAFFYKGTRQIYRRMVEEDISTATSDILILEGAMQHIPVSDLSGEIRENMLAYAESCKETVLRIKQEEEEKSRQLTGLPNIGIERAKRLEAIGFACAEDLVTSSLTTEEIWEKVFAIFPAADFAEIYAIEGARKRIRSTQISKERKQELRAFVESIRGPWPWSE